MSSIIVERMKAEAKQRLREREIAALEKIARNTEQTPERESDKGGIRAWLSGHRF